MKAFRSPEMYPKQLAAFYPQSGKRDSYIEASTKSGKTWGAMVWIMDQAWKTPGIYWWVAPVFRQVNMAYNRLYKEEWLQGLGLDFKKTPYLYISLPNGSRVEFFSAEKPDNLYGDEVHGIVVDEASRVKEECFQLFSSLTLTNDAPSRFIGNVLGRNNRFYELSRMAEAGSLNAEYHRIVAMDAVEQGTWLTVEAIEERRAVLPDHEFGALYECRPYEGDYLAFEGAENVDACVAEMGHKRVVAWGVDLGRSGKRGGDYTVVTGLDEDCRVVFTDRWKGMKFPDQKVRLRKIIPEDDWVGFDATGLGGPPAEDLIREGYRNLIPYVFGNVSKAILINRLISAVKTRSIQYPKEYAPEMKVYEKQQVGEDWRYSHPIGTDMHDDYVDSLALALHAYVQRLGREPSAVTLMPSYGDGVRPDF